MLIFMLEIALQFFKYKTNNQYNYLHSGKLLTPFTVNSYLAIVNVVNELTNC